MYIQKSFIIAPPIAILLTHTKAEECGMLISYVTGSQDRPTGCTKNRTQPCSNL